MKKDWQIKAQIENDMLILKFFEPWYASNAERVGFVSATPKYFDNIFENRSNNMIFKVDGAYEG